MKVLKLTVRGGNKEEILINPEAIESIKEVDMSRNNTYATNITGISGTIYGVEESPEKVYKAILALTKPEKV